MKTQTKPLVVKEGRTELSTDNRTFIYPALGPGNYEQVREQIDAAGLQRPTMADTADLVHTAFHSDDKYSQEIRDIVKDRRLWAFERNLYVPKGVYIYPEPDNGRPLNESELVERLEASDPSVRFVHFGFEIGEMRPMQLAKNDYVIALAGEEGADKLAEVADQFERKPYLWSFKSVNEPTTRVSALNSYWDFARRLGVYGNDHGNWSGRAFGVRSAREK